MKERDERFDALLERFIPSEPERTAAHEDTPLSLTPAQRQRIFNVLADEVGPYSATNILARIEREV